jgi:hypothetical protein
MGIIFQELVKEAWNDYTSSLTSEFKLAVMVRTFTSRVKKTPLFDSFLEEMYAVVMLNKNFDSRNNSPAFR